MSKWSPPWSISDQTDDCQRPLPASSMQWTMKYLEDNWLSGVSRCLFSPRYLPFWSCPAWRRAKHNLSGLLNSVTRRKKTPVAPPVRPLCREKSSWQALNGCNAVWPAVIPNQFLPWVRTFSYFKWFCFARFYRLTHTNTWCCLFLIYKCASVCFFLTLWNLRYVSVFLLC